MHAPFSGVIGTTNELKVIQFLMPLKGMEFNITELARGIGVSRQTLGPVIKKLAKWNVLRIASKHGDAHYYTINADSGFVEVFEELNNRIIEQILGEEVLDRIARISLERCIQIQPIETPQVSYIKSWAGAAGGSQAEWSHIIFDGGESRVVA